MAATSPPCLKFARSDKPIASGAHAMICRQPALHTESASVIVLPFRMTSHRKTLSSEELRTLLETLDRVMADAEHLRRQVTQQLSDGRKRQQQMLSPASSRRGAQRSARDR